MEELLLKILRADSDLANLLGSKSSGTDTRPLVDWMTRPDSGAYPALTLSVVSVDDTKKQRGVGCLRSDRVQFDFWGLRYADVKLASRRVIEKFGPVDGVWPSFGDTKTRITQVHLDNGRDMPVVDAKGGDRVFHFEADFMVFWEPRAQA